MSPKRYAWKGWRMPILHPRDPDYCEHGCPICRSARQGHRLARLIQKVELALSRDGCWWGRARARKYGVRPDEPLPRERLFEEGDEGETSPSS